MKYSVRYAFILVAFSSLIGGSAFGQSGGGTTPGGGGSPGGSTTQVQYNNASAFGGISGLTSDGISGIFASGNLKLSGATSGTSIVNAPATGGGTATLPAGAGTLVYSGSLPSGANPSASLGLTAVNGSATTFMRSDGAPALDQSIAPTWTGAHIFSVAGAASTPGVKISGARFTGGSGTTTFPQFLVQESTATAATTWSTSGTAFGINMHTASGNLAQFRVDGAIQATIGADGGYTTPGGEVTGYNLVASGNYVRAPYLLFGNGTNLQSPSLSKLQLGPLDAAAPVAQTLSVQSVVAGTTNTAGALWKLSDSTGTGSATSGGFEFDVHPLGGSGTAQNAASAALTISGAGLVATPLITSDSTHTDSSVCQDTTTHALYSGSGTLGVCLGTSSIRFKRNVTSLSDGLPQIIALHPVNFRFKDTAEGREHGDPKKVQYGFIAEDAIKVLPKLTGKNSKGQINTFDYIGLIPVLVKAMQEQQDQIKAMRAHIATLERKH